MKSKKRSEFLQQLIFTGLTIFLFLVVVAIPFVMGIYYSMTDWNGVSKETNWVGLQNYVTVFTNDKAFAESFWFTTRFTVVAVLLINVFGFSLAYFLTKNIRARNPLRTIFFMPNVLGGVLLGFIWRFIFVGGFDAVGKVTGIPFFNLPWLANSSTGFWGLIIVSIWQSAGYVMVIYIAGLSAVPLDLKEAARLDGASEGRVLTKVILPVIMPSVTVCLFYTVSHTYKMYELNVSLTSGGPYRSTESVAMNIVTEAFTNSRYGLGTAKSIILFIVIALITYVQSSLSRKWEVDV